MTNALHRDHALTLEAGAWVYKEIDGVRHPITIVWDNGVAYEYILGHHSVNFSNNRSLLFFDAKDPSK